MVSSTELIRKVIRVKGKENQILQTMEELSELSAAINHYRRGKITVDKLYLEIGDVYFMLKQLEYLFVLDSRLVEQAKLNSLERLEGKLNG